MMKIVIEGDIKSLLVDGIEMIKPAIKNLADEFLKHEGTPEYTGIVEDIQKWYYGTMVKDAWCATSLSYFAEQCGISKQTGKHENVDRIKDYMNKRGKIRMSKAYGGNYTPKRGDVIFFSKPETFNDCTHVGTVLSVTGNSIKWIGGNTGDAISSKTNLFTDKYVVCFGEIDY